MRFRPVLQLIYQMRRVVATTKAEGQATGEREHCYETGNDALDDRRSDVQLRQCRE